jgi:hypothetical protein
VADWWELLRTILSGHGLRAALSAGFLALIAGFYLVQPYRLLFFSNESASQILYSLTRLIFCVYYFAILFSIGNLVVPKSVRVALSPLEEVAISVVVGSAVLRLAMLLLGFAGLYQWLLLAIIGTLIVWLGAPRFVELARSIALSIWQSWTSRDSDRSARIVISLALIASCTIVVVFKFLFPNGTGDYFSHYLPYYEAVTARGDIWPNEVWYHFFVSKGAGDTFLAIILSDVLGPLTVSCAMFFTGLVLMYCMVRSGGRDSLVALAATAVTAAGFIWTVETTIGFRHWAEFSKEHLTTAVLFLGCFWAVWRQKTVPAAAARSWSYLTAAAFVGLVLLRVQFAAIALLFLGMVAAFEYFAHARHDAWKRMVPAAAVLLTAVAVLVLNYAITGLLEVTPFRTFWRFADQERFAQWVSPFLMLLLALGSSPDLGSVSPPDLTQFPVQPLLVAIFRLDRLAPFLLPFGLPLIAAVAMSALLLRKVPEARRLFTASYAGICAAVVLAGALMFLSVNQVGSLFRLYMFMMFPIVALAALPFAIWRSFTTGLVRTGVGLLLAGLAALAPVLEVLKIPAAERELAGRFLIGRASISEAYASQRAVWPAALEMSAKVPRNAPIWISQVGWQFCIAPPCNLQSFFSFSMGPQWAAIMFDTPAVAKAALQKEGLNYFAIDTAAPFFDLLPYSALFRPETIGDYFGLVWTDGTVYLLTWRSEQTSPLPLAFYEGYRKIIGSAKQFADFDQLYGRLADLYGKWKAQPRWPIELDPALPRIRGWQ